MTPTIAKPGEALDRALGSARSQRQHHPNRQAEIFASSLFSLELGDLYCGAGGSSSGLVRAANACRVAFNLTGINHWDIAIASNKANHPYAQHHKMELEDAHADVIFPRRRVTVLWASPACTEHSYAKGGSSIDDQNRANAFSVPRLVRELHEYAGAPDIIIVENVVPFVKWGPIVGVLNPDGTAQLDKKGGHVYRPIKERKGETFRDWFTECEAAGPGYRGEWRTLNAADYGEAQSRLRFFAVFTAPGISYEWPCPTHSREGQDGLPRWEPARKFIDFSIPSHSMFARKQPLKPNTVARIMAGAPRHCSAETVDSFLAVLRRQADAQSLHDALPTVIADCLQFGRVEPGVDPYVVRNQTNNMPVSVDDPAPTVTTATGGGLVLAQPEATAFVFANRFQNRARAVDEEPVPTIVAEKGGGGLHLAEASATPFVIGQQSNAAPRSTDDSLPTIATAGKISVVEPSAMPFVLGQHGMRALEPNAAKVNGSLTEGEGLGADAFIVSHGGLKPGQDGVDRTRSLDEPAPTATATGAGYVAQPTAEAFVVDYAMRDGEGSGKEPSAGTAIDDPLGTVLTRDRFGVAEPGAAPFVFSYYGQGNGGEHRDRGMDEPIPTLTTANRVALVQPFLVAHFGERLGQAPRTHSLDKPVPTVTHRGAGDLAIPISQEIAALVIDDVDDAEPILIARVVDPSGGFQGFLVRHRGRFFVIDISFRMLQPEELKQFQGLPRDYVLAGNKSDQTAQIGNAVAEKVAYALGVQAFRALGFEPVVEDSIDEAAA